MNANAAARGLLLAVLLACGQAHAFGVTLLPGSQREALAGETIGFGYQIQNTDATRWLVIDSVSAGSFASGSPSAALLGFPLLAPGASLTVTYVPGISGLFEVAWDADAPQGSASSGSFVVGATFYAGDPAAGGQPVGAAPPVSVAYVLRVTGDRDLDHVADVADNCPVWPNDQADVNANGIGDTCECGDQSGDGRVSVSDLVAINAAIFNPALATPLCDTNQDSICDVRDIIGANLKIFGAAAWCSRYPRP